MIKKAFDIFLLGLIGLGLTLTVLGGVLVAGQPNQPAVTWHHACFVSFEGSVGWLRNLTKEQQDRTKIVVIPNEMQDSITLGSAFCLVYPSN